MRVILASSSPRRAELMKMLEVPYEIISKDVKEEINLEVDCYQNCMNIAKRKALEVFNEAIGDVCVIGSDTIVVNNSEIYGKPKDLNDAYRMIKNISGKEHEVISSLCVLIRKNGVLYEELTYDKCNVYTKVMSDDEISDWIYKHDVITRAGAYAIQDGFAKYIEKIEGDYFSIVGLPVHKLYEIFNKYGIRKG